MPRQSVSSEATVYSSRRGDQTQLHRLKVNQTPSKAHVWQSTSNQSFNSSVIHDNSKHSKNALQGFGINKTNTDNTLLKHGIPETDLYTVTYSCSFPMMDISSLRRLDCSSAQDICPEETWWSPAEPALSAGFYISLWSTGEVFPLRCRRWLSMGQDHGWICCSVPGLPAVNTKPHWIH